MGLFDSIKNRIKSKSEAKKELAERIKNEEVQLSSFEKDYFGKYIFRYNYKNHENTNIFTQVHNIGLHNNKNQDQKTKKMIEKNKIK